MNVRLPASIASANLAAVLDLTVSPWHRLGKRHSTEACQGGSVRFDEESKADVSVLDKIEHAERHGASKTSLQVIVWNLGKLASQADAGVSCGDMGCLPMPPNQESKAEGTLTYATNPKAIALLVNQLHAFNCCTASQDGSVQIPNEEKSTAQLATF